MRGLIIIVLIKCASFVQHIITKFDLTGVFSKYLIAEKIHRFSQRILYENQLGRRIMHIAMNEIQKIRIFLCLLSIDTKLRKINCEMARERLARAAVEY